MPEIGEKLIVQTGTDNTLYELPSPPFLSIDGVYNFRDVGCWYPMKGGELRNRYIFRSGELSRITSQGKQQLKELGITTIYDLRSVPEVETPLVEIPGIEQVSMPVCTGEDYSPEIMALQYPQEIHNKPALYDRIYASLLEIGAPSYRQILLHIRDQPKDCFVFHCDNGKHRTGLLAALLLSFLGVDEDVIAVEYQLSQLGAYGWKSPTVAPPAQEAGFGWAGRMASTR